MDVFLGVVIFIVAIILLRSIVQVNEYERGVKFHLGKFNKIINPGWRLILPIVETYKKVDIRTKVVDVPEQDAITTQLFIIRFLMQLKLY